MIDWSAVAIVGVAAGGGCLLAWRSVAVTRRQVDDHEKLTAARLDAVKKELEGHRAIQAEQWTALDAHHLSESTKLEAILSEWREMSTELKVMMAEQAVINRTTAGALSAVTDKLERQERIISTHETSIEVLKANTRRRLEEK